VRAERRAGGTTDRGLEHVQETQAVQSGNKTRIDFKACRDPNGRWPPLQKFDLVMTWWTHKAQLANRSTAFPANNGTASLLEISADSGIENQAEIKYALRSYEQFGLLEYVRDIVIFVEARVIDAYGKPRFFNYSKKAIRVMTDRVGHQFGNYSKKAIRVVTDRELGIEVDLHNCDGCSKWNRRLMMHTIPGLSEYFLYVPDDNLLINKFHISTLWDANKGTPILRNYGTYTDGWCGHNGDAFGTAHGPILMNKCAMKATVDLYRDEMGFGIVRDKVKGRYLDALCLFSNAVENEWVYNKSNVGFHQECHTNDGCKISDLEKNQLSLGTKTLFVNLQGQGVSDEYPANANIEAAAASFLHKTYPLPSRFEVDSASDI